MKDKRQPKMFAIVAEPGAGKTSRMIEHIENQVAKGGRVIVIDPEGGEDAWNRFIRIDDVELLKKHPKFTGVVVLKWQEGVTFKALRNLTETKKLTNWTLILDDPNVYATPVPEEDLAYFLRRKRQGGVDFLTTAHTWKELPPKFIRFIDYFELGPTGLGNPDERSKELGVAACRFHWIWKRKADQNSRDAKKAGEFHKWFAFTKDGLHPVTLQPPTE